MWRDKIPTGKVAWFALHTGLLFAAMTAIYVVLGNDHFSPLSSIICVVYAGWPVFRPHEKWKTSVSGKKTTKLALACNFSGAAAALALNASLPRFWYSGAYRWGEPGVSEKDPFSSVSSNWMIWENYFNRTEGNVVLLLMSALLLGLALAHRPQVQKAEHDGSKTPLSGLGAISILSFWIWGFVFVAILILLHNLTISADAVFGLLDNMIWDRVPTTWDFFLFYPALPVGILVVAVMAITLRDVLLQFELPADGRTDGAPVLRFGFRVPGFAAAAVAGLTAFVGVNIYVFHFGFVAASASVPAFLTSVQSRRALDGWIGEQREAGRTDAEIVAAVNTGGHWSPDAPAAGLASLLSAPEETPADVVEGWACPVTVAAGIVAAAELAAAPWPDMSARPRITRGNQGREEPENAPADDAEEPMAESAPPAVRYCIKVTCPSPVAWRAPDAISLGASHASASPDWMHLLYFDFHADGVASAPGGYCTADGRLADTYQG